MISTADAVNAVREVLANKGRPADALCDESRFRELRFDSLDFAEVLVILEAQTNCELDLGSALPLVCVKDLTRLAAR